MNVGEVSDNTFNGKFPFALFDPHLRKQCLYLEIPIY